MARIYFATNRNPIGGDPPTSFGTELGPFDGKALRYGYAEVDLDNKRLVPGSLKVAEERLFWRNENQPPVFGSRETLDRLRADMCKNGRPTFVSIHGFNYTFEEAMVRTAQAQAFHGIDSNWFVFTWPSDGSSSRYHSDRADAEKSGLAAGRALETATRFLARLRKQDRCGESVHLVAHSMGAYALRHAVQGLRSEHGDALPRLFDKIFLFAPDEDADAFESAEKLKLLPRMGHRIVVYHTTRDAALDTSVNTKGTPARLGSGGPENTTQIADKVSVVDVSGIVDDGKDRTNHQYYWRSPKVRSDVRAVIDDIAPHLIPGRIFLPDTLRFRLVPV